MPLSGQSRTTQASRKPKQCSSTPDFLSVGTALADVSARPFHRLLGLVLRAFYPDPQIAARPKISKVEKTYEPTTRDKTPLSNEP
jgi:hypothetical protein